MTFLMMLRRVDRVDIFKSTFRDWAAEMTAYPTATRKLRSRTRLETGWGRPTGAPLKSRNEIDDRDAVRE